MSSLALLYKTAVLLPLLCLSSISAAQTAQDTAFRTVDVPLHVLKLLQSCTSSGSRVMRVIGRTCVVDDGVVHDKAYRPFPFAGLALVLTAVSMRNALLKCNSDLLAG